MRWVVVGAGLGLWARSRLEATSRRRLDSMVHSVAPDRLADGVSRRVRDAVEEGVEGARRREADLRGRIHGAVPVPGAKVLDVTSVELDAAANRTPRPHPARYGKTRR